MRRCLHAFLIGVLTLALTTDSARACWYLRRSCRAPRPCVVACPPPRACGVVVVSDVAVGGWSDAPPSGAGCGCGETSAVLVEDVWFDGVVTHGPSTVVAPHAVPVPMESGPPGLPSAIPAETSRPDAPPPPATAAQSPVAPSAPTLPTLQPTVQPTVDPVPEEVQQTTALTEDPAPADEPAPVEPESPAPESPETDTADIDGESPSPADEAEMPSDDAPTAEPVAEEPVAEEPVAEEPAEPAPPAEPNLFEEAEGAPAGEPLGESAPEDQPQPQPEAELPSDSPAEPMEPAEEPVADASDAAPSDDEIPVAGPEMEEGVEEGVEEAGEEPVDPPLGDEEPAVQPDPFDGAGGSGEPLRRWIDKSGDYAVVATLVEVLPNGSCVLSAAGRRLTVPLDSLSDHDRGYAEQARQRIASRRAVEPESGDTASM